MTIVQTPHVVLETRVKLVPHMVSIKQRLLLTIISASGNIHLPVFVFPCTQMYAEFMANSPEGSISLANRATSSWMSKNLLST